MRFLLQLEKGKNEMTNFVTEPKVRLVGRPVVDIGGLQSFLEDHNLEWPEFQKKLDSSLDLGDRDGEWLMEMAGRTCYMSWPQKGSELKKGRSHDDHIKHIIEVQHGSVLEHLNLNFEIWNVSRSLTHELVRHRAGMAYSQLSQRYVDESDTEFVIPPAIQQLGLEKPEILEEYKKHLLTTVEYYKVLTNHLSDMYANIEDKTERRKRAREAARSVLPNATETKVFTTFNGRAIRHFIEMRGSLAADAEIRCLAIKLFRIVEAEFPLLMHGMSVEKSPSGLEYIESKFRKV